MNDIKLSSINGMIDLNILGVDFEKDNGLETAVIMSLFTDQRVTDEELPPHEECKRGYWGDLTQSYQLGSKLWTLGRSKMTNETVEKIKELAKDSLKWMISDGVAKKIEVNAYKAGTYQINLEVKISRPKQEISKYNYLWSSQLGEV